MRCRRDSTKEFMFREKLFIIILFYYHYYCARVCLQKVLEPLVPCCQNKYLSWVWLSAFTKFDVTFMMTGLIFFLLLTSNSNILCGRRIKNSGNCAYPYTPFTFSLLFFHSCVKYVWCLEKKKKRRTSCIISASILFLVVPCEQVWMGNVRIFYWNESILLCPFRPMCTKNWHTRYSNFFFSPFLSNLPWLIFTRDVSKYV